MGGINVYSDWFGALDERNLPTEPDDVNGIVEASAAEVWEGRSVTTGSTLPVVAAAECAVDCPGIRPDAPPAGVRAAAG